MSDEWIGKRVIPIEGNPAQLCSSVWTCRGYENGKLVLEGAPGIRYNLAPRYVMLAPEIEKKDILERAKRVEYPDSALRILPGLIAEVEAKDKQIKELQNIINKPPEEAQWMTDYHLLQSALDGPIIESARRWHGAFRKAQNSNLIRRQQNARLGAEVERLRSERDYWRQLFQNIQGDRDLLIERDARIKELEEANRNIDKRRDEMAAFIERLEAAFLRSNAAMRYYQEGNRGPWPQVGEQFKEPYIQKAREALEEIRCQK